MELYCLSVCLFTAVAVHSFSQLLRGSHFCLFALLSVGWGAGSAACLFDFV